MANSRLIRESKRDYRGIAVSMRRRGVPNSSFQEIYYEAFTIDGREVCAGYASAFYITHMGTMYKFIKQKIDAHLKG